MLRLGERLLYTDIAILVQADSRRDSTGSADTPKHSLHFTIWANAFRWLLVNQDGFVKSMSTSHSFNGSSIRNAILADFGGRAMDAIVTLLTHIASKPEHVKSPFSTANYYLVTVLSVLVSEWNNDKGLFDDIFNKSAQIFKLVRSMTIHVLPKLHLDDPSQKIIDTFRHFMTDGLDILIRRQNLSSDDVFDLILKEVAEYTNPYDLVASSNLQEDGITSNVQVSHRHKMDLGENARYASVNICGLEYHNALIRSSNVELRIKGTQNLGSQALRTHNNHDDIPAHACQLMKSLTAKFILSNDILAYLFGPQSHARLIANTFNIVGYLTVNNYLTQKDADAIWSVFNNSQQPDNAQSAYFVLYELAAPSVMDATNINYFLNKYRDMPISQFSKLAEVLFAQLIQSLQARDVAHAFDSSHACIWLLSKIHDMDNEPARQHAMFGSLEQILGGLPSPADQQEQLGLLELCAGPITSMLNNATGYVQALLCIMKPQQGFCLPSSDILSRLSFKQCLDELLQFLEHTKRGDRPFIPQALKCRVNLAFLILSISGADPDILALEREFLNHIVGEPAFAPGIRDMGWDLLVANLKRRPSLEGFFQRCISQFLPALSPDLVTINTGKIFVLQSERQEADETVLLPLSDELIKFALSCPVEQVCNQFTVIISGHLFQGKAVKYPKLAIDNQVAVTKECIAQLPLQNESSFRAAQLLRLLLLNSVDFEKTVQPKEQPASNGVDHARSELASDNIQIPIRVHKGNAKPQRTTVTVNKSANCSELDAAIISETGFDSYKVISAGRMINFAEGPQQLIEELGLEEGKLLIVQKRNTLQSIQEDANNIKGKSSVEKELMSHLDILYGTLDEQTTTANYVLQILARLGFPGPIRALVASPDTPFDQVFPSAKSLRLRASLELLHIQLKEQVALGIADEKFLLHGVHLLIDLLHRSDLLQDAFDIWKAAEILFEFLRERPVDDAPEEYFKDAAAFTRRVLQIILDLQQQIHENTYFSHKPLAIRALYQCLLEGVLLSPSVRSTFLVAENNAQVHRKLLLTSDQHLNTVMPSIMISMVHNANITADVRSLLSSMFIHHLIPAALENPVLCGNLFAVAIEVVASDFNLRNDEGLLRSLIDNFSSTLLHLEHWEGFGSGFVDRRVQGLTGLLRCCVQSIKDLNKPINHKDLASALFKTLLFPSPGANNTAKPIITLETRKNIYDLIRLLCENLQVLTDIIDDCQSLFEHAEFTSEFNFPGADRFVRNEGNYAGLDNLSQTCYMNSLIQQLFMNIHFRKFILDTPVVDSEKQTVLLEFKVAFARMQNSHGPTYRPEGLARALNVDVTIQDDAHIFFTMLIGQLEDSMPDEETKNTLRAFFGGVNKSQTAGSCGHVSESTDSYFNLSLVVKDKATLEESLNEYTKGAALEGSDRFKCTTCGSGEGVYVDAVRRTALDRIPDNLVMGLKRFRYETYDGGAKVNDRFDFPEKIDMGKYKLNRLADVEGTNEPDMFQLVGVVVHQGTLQLGHYWSYAAERGHAGPESLPWFKLEDSTVFRVSLEDVLRETCGGPISMSSSSGQPLLRTDNAYILFYQRVSSVHDSARCLAPNLFKASTTTHANVRLPEKMDREISEENEQMIFLLNLFSADHLDFVRGLASRLEELKQKDSPESAKAEGRVFHMFWMYYNRVFTRSFPNEAVDYASLLLQKLACSRKEYAAWLLQAIVPRNAEHNMSPLLHRRQAVRQATSRLILACVKYLRETTPGFYGLKSEDSGKSDIEDNESNDPNNCVIEEVIYDLVDLLRFLPDCRNTWREYFDLMGQIAVLGRFETHLMLEQDLLHWCLEVMMIREDPALQKKHPRIVQHYDNKRTVNLGAVVHCIYSLLHKFVSLWYKLPQGETQRRSASGTLLLTDDEWAWLNTRSSSGGNLLVEQALAGLVRPKMTWVPKDIPYRSTLTEPNSDWRDWSATQLAVLLTDVKAVPEELYDDATSAILINLGNSTRWDHFADAAALCLTGRKMLHSTEELIFEEMKKTTARSELGDVADTMLWVTRQVYAAQPLMIIRHVAPLAHNLLNCGWTEAEENTSQWLKDDILVHTPIRQPYQLAGATILRERLCAVKDLLRNLIGTLMVAFNARRSYEEYICAISTYDACVTYLKQVAEILEPEAEAWCNNDGLPSEDHSEIETAAQELFDEVRDIDDFLQQQADCYETICGWYQEKVYRSSEFVEDGEFTPESKDPRHIAEC